MIIIEGGKWIDWTLLDKVVPNYGFLKFGFVVCA